jgi:hypothetical protein
LLNQAPCHPSPSFVGPNIFLIVSKNESNKSILHSRSYEQIKFHDVWHHSVQNLFSSHLLSKSLDLSVVMYGCGTLLLTLRDEHGLWVSENRTLRRIFGSMRWKEVGGWRRLHSEELHNLYASLNIN